MPRVKKYKLYLTAKPLNKKPLPYEEAMDLAKKTFNSDIEISVSLEGNIMAIRKDWQESNITIPIVFEKVYIGTKPPLIWNLNP